MKTIIEGIGISIVLKNNSTLTINNGILLEIEGSISFKEKNVQLLDNGNHVRVIIDENEASKGNYFTEIKKQDIYSVWYKGEQIKIEE